MQNAPHPRRPGHNCVPHLLLCTGILLILFAAIPHIARTYHSGQRPQRTSATTALDEYTFVGDDYPAYYPLEAGQVSLTPENTIHYQIFTEDAEREWTSIFPDGGGFLRLGPEGRPFGLALFHQMHCLVRIRRAMSLRQSSEHVHHCFNYLRQTILCEANPTIEPVIPIVGRRSVNAEIPRVCNDWTQLYSLAAENYRRQTSERRRGEGADPMYI